MRVSLMKWNDQYSKRFEKTYLNSTWIDFQPFLDIKCKVRQLGLDACVLHQLFNEIAEWCILEKTWNKRTWLWRMSKTKRKKIMLIPWCLVLYSEGTWGTFTIQSCAYWKILGQESIFLVTFVKWNSGLKEMWSTIVIECMIMVRRA